MRYSSNVYAQCSSGAYMALPIVGKFFHKTYRDPKFAELKSHTFKSPEPELLAMLSEPGYKEMMDIEKKKFDVAGIFKKDEKKSELQKKQKKDTPPSKEKKRLWAKIKNAFPEYNITLTGHSLGSSLGMKSATENNIKGVFFNGGSGIPSFSSFLKDRTGSSRFLVLPVQKLDGFHNIDMLQLYKQIIETIGYQDFELDDDEKERQKLINIDFEQPDLIAEQFENVFETEFTEGGVYQNCTEILEHMGYSKRDISRSVRCDMAAVLKKYNLIYAKNTKKFKVKLK